MYVLSQWGPAGGPVFRNQSDGYPRSLRETASDGGAHQHPQTDQHPQAYQHLHALSNPGAKSCKSHGGLRSLGQIGAGRMGYHRSG